MNQFTITLFDTFSSKFTEVVVLARLLPEALSSVESREIANNPNLFIATLGGEPIVELYSPNCQPELQFSL